MVTRPIGWYVHHQGEGHRARALAVARRLPRLVLLGTGIAGRTGRVPAIDLPDDRREGAEFDGADGATRPLALHYAPIDHDGVRRRTARVAGWIAAARPALFVVDVSVEIAMLARLAATPTVYVRLAGRRDDPAHAEAFRGARALLAPFHAALDDPATPPAIRARTVYAPGLVARPAAVAAEPGTVLVAIGRGGAGGDGGYWAAAARATPGWRWRVIGPCDPPPAPPANLAIDGWVEDAADAVARAGVVVGGAGDGLVGAVLAARRPFVCLPEPRAYDEQHAKARALAAAGAAIVCEQPPVPADWLALLAAATALRPEAAAALDDPNGPARLARRLAAIADGGE